MAASNDAVREIVKVLRQYVDHATLERVVNDLLDMPGNKGFRDTIEVLAHGLVATKAVSTAEHAALAKKRRRR
jgi:hypothetical protein